MVLWEGTGPIRHLFTQRPRPLEMKYWTGSSNAWLEGGTGMDEAGGRHATEAQRGNPA